MTSNQSNATLSVHGAKIAWVIDATSVNMYRAASPKNGSSQDKTVHSYSYSVRVTLDLGQLPDSLVTSSNTICRSTDKLSHMLLYREGRKQGVSATTGIGDEAFSPSSLVLACGCDI